MWKRNLLQSWDPYLVSLSFSTLAETQLKSSLQMGHGVAHYWYRQGFLLRHPNSTRSSNTV